MRYKILKRGMNTISFLLIVYDIFTINLSYLAALWLRFDCKYNTIPARYLDPAFEIMPFYTVVMLVTLASLRLYQSVWRYASVPELMRVLSA